MDTWNYAEYIVLTWIQRYVAIDVAIDSFLVTFFFIPVTFFVIQKQNGMWFILQKYIYDIKKK